MRLFIGVPVPPSPQYDELAADVQRIAPAARTVGAGTWHATLRFLGDVLEPAPVVTALESACTGRPMLPCVVEGLGAFPDAKRARVAWAGLRAPGIEALAAAVEQATAHLGDPPERRRFVAHVTLARLPKPTDLRSLVDRHRDTLVAEGRLDRVVLYRSHLGPDGSTYEPLHEARLGEP